MVLARFFSPTRAPHSPLNGILANMLYLAFLAAALPSAFAATYSLSDTFQGNSFLTQWSHEAISDPTHGRV